jgi:protein SCO1/2
MMAAWAALADGAAREAARKPGQKVAGYVNLAYTDALLVDQDGNARRLKSDVFRDRLVVMDFAYTTCTTICPVLTAVLVKVQDQLGERVGSEVQMVTLSVDPASDTPARLKEYADRNGVKPGWTWLTGPVTTVNDVLREFNVYTPAFADHPPLILVGDAASGKWIRFYSIASPADIVAKVDELRAARAVPPQR